MVNNEQIIKIESVGMVDAEFYYLLTTDTKKLAVLNIRTLSRLLRKELTELFLHVEDEGGKMELSQLSCAEYFLLYEGHNGIGY